MLRRIEAQYGKAQRIWVMDRGIPTEEVLAEMRQADPPISYLVGTPKGRLSKLEKALLDLPWQAVRQGVEVKLLPQENELYVLAQSHARIHKERAMRRRKLAFWRAPRTNVSWLATRVMSVLMSSSWGCPSRPSPSKSCVSRRYHRFFRRSFSVERPTHRKTHCFEG
jgi:hypothetical protein